ncbi:methyltransferase domain-containing protein [Atopomonas sediminilitoris]|uniref:methyltransferase domain-containing protein n=1 Tax=Atopomonas sediminilitoris TaxID=2919919 RepID=UPI001F4ED97E|nr:methyltransferase domain-containing protein [Atopomonas sediminilitoris]MCJ8168161.1 methyltransferase domain-containing protein [Atopomonas sediminilitoris]
MHESVQDYYGKTLQSSADLKTSACCDATSMPEWLKPLLGKVHGEVLSRYYGCGLVAPHLLEGLSILDLGSGSGRDCYVLAQMVGASGKVVGVDMTAEQLAVARAHQDYHAEQFGFANVEFRQGYIEQLDALGLADNSFDVIVSNCVINLSPDKDAVLREAYRLLKPGGELYFSDVYADRRVPAAVRDDAVLYGECLGGALYWNDFENLAKRHGFSDPRLVEDRPIAVTDPTLAAKTGNIRFYSATYRLFKLKGLEPACEDYGQAVIYHGTIPSAEQAFALDKHHLIQAGKVFPVCGNTWHMLHATRFAPHFTFIGDFSRHYGLFEGCGGGIPYDNPATADAASCC